MNEPPDPGGFVPPACNYVTIQSNNESGMETDGSTSSRTLKRSRTHTRVCKHCNKRRKHHGSEGRSSDCNCLIESAHQIPTSQPDLKTASPSATPNLNKAPTMSIPEPIGRKSYAKTDAAPYVVHVQKIQAAPNDGTTIHPMSFGRFLKKTSFRSIINGSVKRIGRNKISVSFSDSNDANNFINHTDLVSNQYKAFIPTFNVTRMGLVRGVPAEWSLDEVKENISVPVGCGEVLKIRRLNFKTFIDGSPTWKPSQTVVLTFDGQVLPKRIFICYNALTVDLYIFPTIQCYNCCRYGHTKLNCRSKPCCYKCGQDHSGESCDVTQENASCCLCTGYHFAINKSCPEYNRQTQIKTYMAQNCVSYAEAFKLHPPISKSYADVLSSSPVKTNNVNLNIPQHLSANRPFPSTSYKKTVFSKPKSPPIITKGYDKLAHNALIKEYAIPTPRDGCAINNNLSHPNMQLHNDFVTAFMNLLNQFNIVLPSNAAPVTQNSFANQTHNGSSNPMELQEHYK